MDGIINMLVWAGGAVTGFVSSKGIKLDEKIQSILGSIKGLSTNKWVGYLLALAIWAFVAAGGFAAVAKFGKGGMRGAIGHFVSGFGAGALLEQALNYPEVGA